MSEINLDEDVEMRAEDTFSNSPEGSSDEEDADEGKLEQLKNEVEASPYTYDLHVQLISLCRKLGDLDKLRAAREKMSALFPLTPDLWLEWLSDEKTLAITQEQKDTLTDLFERALRDYPSVSVWLEYVQFSIGKIGDSWDSAGLAAARNTFERAVTSIGIHVREGCLIWEAYREFESAYLIHMKNKDASLDDIKSQEEKVYLLFKRQLSVPLLDMDKTYEEFQEFQFDSCSTHSSAVSFTYEKSLKKLEQLTQYEEALYTSEDPHYDEFKSYIEFEKKDGDPSRVQSIYERALIVNCLRYELWLDYAKYMDRVVKIKEMSLAIYERAVRNCPWCSQLWCLYGRALERYNETHNKIVETFENSLGMGFTKADDFKELWMSYLQYLRRRIDRESQCDEISDNLQKEILDILERATTQMKEYFWGSESEYTIMKFHVYFKAKYMKDMESVRNIWREVINHGHKEEAQVWLDYANFERLRGDSAHYRKILLQALSSVRDWPETFIDLLITFEHEEGTLDSLEKTLMKCETQMVLINERRLKQQMAEMESNLKNENMRREKRHQTSRSPKKDTKSFVQMDSEGFKIPPLPSHKPISDGRPHDSGSERSQKRLSEEENEDESQQKHKKRKMESSESHGASVKHDSAKDIRTVFVSNLAYEVDEDKIKEFFISVGEVEEVRLVKDYKGRSKGFCYVVFKSQEPIKAALSKDREPMDGRPVLVSPCEDKKKNPLSLEPKFKFSTGLERNKLFIKNLPTSTTKEDLEKMFGKYGALKDVRLVTYRNGHSKGLAYVDFKDETCASRAVVELDGSQVLENVISVAISNPPPRKPKKDFSTPFTESLGGGGSVRGRRGRGRTQLSLVPRSLMRSSNASSKATNGVQNGDSSSSSSEPQKPLSNSDFAKMLTK